jgi:hypothetical protein
MPDDDDGLRNWLLRRAGVHRRFVDRVMEQLEAEEVCTVADVGVLAGLPRFQECGFSAVTAAKILDALADPASSGADDSAAAALARWRRMHVAFAAVVESPDLSLCILKHLHAVQDVHRFSQVCRLWSSLSNGDSTWKGLCHARWGLGGGAVRSSEPKALFKRLYLAEEPLSRRGLPQTLDDCMLFFTSGVGRQLRSDGTAVVNSRRSFDLATVASSARWPIAEPVPFGDVATPIRKIHVPRIGEYFDAVHDEPWASLQANNWPDQPSDPSDIIGKEMACTLVSKLDGRMVRMKRAGQAWDVSCWGGWGGQGERVHHWDWNSEGAAGSEWATRMSFAVKGDHVRLIMRGPDNEKASLANLPWEW